VSVDEHECYESLVRAACDDLHSDSSNSSWLSDPDTRRELAELRTLVRELRQALRPQSVSPDLLARLSAVADEARVVKTRKLVAAGLALAAAAVLLLAVFVPTRGGSGRKVEAGVSAAEASALVRAFAELDWAGHIDYGLEQVTREIQQVEQDLSGQRQVRQRFPWGPEDEWDLPTEDASGGLVRTVLLALVGNVGGAAS
jgi:hypothetical protein